MPKIIFVIIISILLLSCTQEQPKKSGGTMTEFVPKNISGWQLQDVVESYDGKTIFDYIDGAGEVYLSYGFNNVSVFRYLKPDAPEVSVEIFDMGSDEDAYGVFTYSRESEQSGIGQVYEQIGSVICFWQSKYFVCVRADEKTEETGEAITQLAKVIDEALPHSGNKPKLLKYIPHENLLPGSIRFLHTHSALNYHHYIDVENILNLDSNTNIVMAEYRAANTFYLVAIEYKADQTALEGYNNFTTRFLPEKGDNGTGILDSGKWGGAQRHSNFLVIVFDAPDSATAEEYMTLFADNLNRNQ